MLTTSADHTRAPCNSRKLVILGEKIFWKDESVVDYLYLVTKTFSYYRPVFPVSQNLFFEVHFWFLLRIRSGTCWETRFWPSIWSDWFFWAHSFFPFFLYLSEAYQKCFSPFWGKIFSRKSKKRRPHQGTKLTMATLVSRIFCREIETRYMIRSSI